MENNKKTTFKPLWAVYIFIIFCIFWGWTIFSRQGAPIVNKAVVVLSGTSVSGSVTFTQTSSDGPVTVSGNIQGLDTQADRGFHIHEYGDLTDGCLSAGPHYNPDGNTHGAPTDAVRHVGDLGNIKSDEAGNAIFSFDDAILSLNGPRSIIGRAVVIHAGTDDLGRGDNEESLRTGNAGGRAACGVIGVQA